jgi:hypothetical protein
MYAAEGMSGVAVWVGLGVMVGVFVSVGVGVFDGVGDGVGVAVFGSGWKGVGVEEERVAWETWMASEVDVAGKVIGRSFWLERKGRLATTSCVGHSNKNKAAKPPIKAIVNNVIKNRMPFCQDRMVDYSISLVI